MVLANTFRTVGYVLAALLIIGFLIYVFLNYRKARPEVGAELELAPNREPYLGDDELETKKLDLTLGVGLATLAVIAVALPMYWLAEPGRMDGAIQMFDDRAVHEGEEIYNEFCAACHAAGGVGGVAPFTLTTDDGDFIAAVEWNAPALNTVLLRYSKDEVRHVIDFGRPATPMQAFGLPGGGSLTEQRVDNVVEYLETVQLSEAAVRDEVRNGLIDLYVTRALHAERERREEEGLDELEDEELDELIEELTAEVEARVDDDVFDYDLDGVWTSKELGQALFNLPSNAGTYSCARCHTKGWSYGRPEEPGGGGGLGFNLTNGATLRQFPTFQAHVAFVIEGGEAGQTYGSGGMSGAGQMPGYGFNPNAEEDDSKLSPEQFLFTQAQIEAVVEYERSL